MHVHVGLHRLYRPTCTNCHHIMLSMCRPTCTHYTYMYIHIHTHAYRHIGRGLFKTMATLVAITWFWRFSDSRHKGLLLQFYRIFTETALWSYTAVFSISATVLLNSCQDTCRHKYCLCGFYLLCHLEVMPLLGSFLWFRIHQTGIHQNIRYWEY